MWASQGGSYEFQLKSCKELPKRGQVPRAEGDSRGTQPVDPAPAAPGSTRGPCRAGPADGCSPPLPLNGPPPAAGRGPVPGLPGGSAGPAMAAAHRAARLAASCLRTPLDPRTRAPAALYERGPPPAAAAQVPPGNGAGGATPGSAGLVGRGGQSWRRGSRCPAKGGRGTGIDRRPGGGRERRAVPGAGRAVTAV